MIAPVSLVKGQNLEMKRLNLKPRCPLMASRWTGCCKFLQHPQCNSSIVNVGLQLVQRTRDWPHYLGGATSTWRRAHTAFTASTSQFGWFEYNKRNGAVQNVKRQTKNFVEQTSPGHFCSTQWSHTCSTGESYPQPPSSYRDPKPIVPGTPCSFPSMCSGACA